MIQQMVAKLLLKLLAFLLALYTSFAAPTGSSTPDQARKDLFLARIILTEIQKKEQTLSPPPTAPVRSDKPVKNRI